MNHGLLARSLIEDVEKLLQVNVYILTIYSTIGYSQESYIVFHNPESFHIVSTNLTEIIKIADKYLHYFLEKEADHNMFLEEYIINDPPCREKNFSNKRQEMLNCFKNLTTFDIRFVEGIETHQLKITLLKMESNDIIQLST